MLPAWLLPSVADVRAECDVRPRQLFTFAVNEDEFTSGESDTGAADEARLDALILSHVQTQGALVWGALADESRSMPFPLTLSVLEAAYPARATATPEEIAAQGELNAQTIENQKTGARDAVKQSVISKLWYAVNGDEAKEKAKNAYITGQQVLGDTKKRITKTRRAWLSNSATLELFY